MDPKDILGNAIDILGNAQTIAALVNPATQIPTAMNMALTPLWRKYVTDKLLNAAGGEMSPEGELMLRSAAASSINAGGEQVDAYGQTDKGRAGWERAEESWGGGAPYAMAGMDVAGGMLSGALRGKAPKMVAGAARFYGDTMKPRPMPHNATDAQRNEWIRNLDEWRNANSFANQIDPPPAREVTAVAGPRMDPDPSIQQHRGSSLAWGKDLPKNAQEEELRAKAVDAWIAREMGMRQPQTQTQFIPGGYNAKPELTKK